MPILDYQKPERRFYAWGVILLVLLVIVVFCSTCILLDSEMRIAGWLWFWLFKR